MMTTLQTPPDLPLITPLSDLPVPVPQRPDAATMARRVAAACDQACAAIAPSWPLDRAIAVHPHWQRSGMTMRQVAARMAVLAGLQVFAPRAQLRDAWQSGRITPSDLAAALADLPEAGAAGWTVERAVAALDETPQLPRLPLLIDVLDDDPQGSTRLSWRQAITHQVSQTCAAYFDEQQADWQPERRAGLYAFWRETLQHDHGIGTLMGLPGLARGLAALPATREQAEAWVMRLIGLPEDAWGDYLEAVLLTVNGWASWCAWLGWEAKLLGRDDPHLRELLAIRLAWGALLLECHGDVAAQRAFAALQVRWEQSSALLQQAEHALLVDELWQSAFEIGWQRELGSRLRAVAPAAAPREVEAQAVFCIDVRSERLRRAVEAAAPTVQTLGFAGFFGLPLAYTPLATATTRPQLPGLLAPALEAQDRIAACEADFGTAGDAQQAQAEQQRRRRFALASRFGDGSRWPNAAFSFVEAIGALQLGPLTRWLRPEAASHGSAGGEGLPARWRPLCRPLLSGLDLAAKIDLAQRVLHAMGLDRSIAPVVLLVGHGSTSANNAQAAALDCGACGGHTGEVNARVLARLLGDPAVQAGLRERGLPLREGTVFIAALHDTTTDQLHAYDLDLLDATAREHWQRLNPAFEQAGDRVRRERAPSLGLDAPAAPEALLRTLQRRAGDGAQTRPEWGLAGNAAFVIAPRSRSLGAVLDGRVFLHDYDATNDADGSVLELLMTAPMVVTHWISGQYHASTCEPQAFGSGNKLLHNVVGGRIGVFEGNGGDLRFGLARQSVHDGRRWMHEPLRLTVVIDAPAEAIDRVLARHDGVRRLVENGWLHLWRFDEGGGFARRHRGHWAALAG